MTIMRFKTLSVYAFGLYIHPDSLCEKLGWKYASVPTAELKNNPGFFRGLLREDIHMTVRLVVNCNGLSINNVRKTFEKCLRSRLEKMNPETDYHCLQKFGSYFSQDIRIPVGTTIDFRRTAECQLITERLQPKNIVSERLATMCVLPLLLAGILGTPLTRDQLPAYLRKLLVHTRDGPFSTYDTTEFIDVVRFLCTFEEHQGTIFNILWEMVVSSDPDLKANAAALLKPLVPYIDVKVTSTHVLPALVILGSDQNLKVKYASIDAFGAVAQHCKNEMSMRGTHAV